MPNHRYLFTSESVTEGHPDKIADQISDAILDACLKEDPYSRVACETLTATGLVVIAGEITTKAYVDFQTLVRGVVASIGYDNALYGFDSNTCAVISSINKQSGDIAMGVDTGGAGDQGMMFGYASNENAETTCRRQFRWRTSCASSSPKSARTAPFLTSGPTANPKSQWNMTRTTSRFASMRSSSPASTRRRLSTEELRADILKHVIQAALPAEMLDEDTKYHINPTGRFVIGGPMGDTGLTGRKIIVDTYGGMGRHGGGAFSGKDPTKVDRSACYMARYIAKNIVAAGLGRPLRSAAGLCHRRSRAGERAGRYVRHGEDRRDKIADLVRANFKLTPKGIIESLNLRRPIYRKTAAYGHFGRNDPDFTWEATDKAAALREQAGLAGASVQKSAKAAK